MQENINQNTSQEMFFDANSALKLAETRDIIEDFVLDFCGLRKITLKNEETEILRFSSPMFTYECAKKLATLIYVEINRITARTDFDTNELKMFFIKKSETMSEWFAHVGITHLISDKAWEHCIELGKPKKKQEDYVDENGETVGTKIVDDYFYNEAGQKIIKNEWFEKYNILWDYNKPVNIDMLRIIKREYELENESFAQDVILRDLFWSVRVFVHGGLARSKNHLTLDHEKVIHKETFASQNQQGEEKKEGWLHSMRQRVRNII